MPVAQLIINTINMQEMYHEYKNSSAINTRGNESNNYAKALTALPGLVFIAHRPV